MEKNKKTYEYDCNNWCDAARDVDEAFEELLPPDPNDWTGTVKITIEYIPEE